MKYKYIALNQAQKTLSGTIDAQNEEDAHGKLNKLSLAVLSIQEINEKVGEKAGYSRYNFEARDQNGKRVVGTIAADTKLNGLKRLNDEYELNVLALYAPNATEAEKAASFQEVKALYQEINKLNETQEQNAEAMAAEKTNAYRREIQAKAEQISEEIQTFLTKFQLELKPEEQDYLQNQIIHIQKIKHTENIENLERSCEKILKYIQEKELFIETSKNLESQTALQLDTQKLLSELKQLEKTNVNNQANSKLLNLKSYQKWWHQIVDAIFSSKPHQDKVAPEIAELNKKIKQARNEIWGYIKLAILTKKKQYRLQSIKALKILVRKWWRLHKELGLKEDQIALKTELQLSPFERNLPFFSGWLLAFYTSIYLLFLFPTIKSFNITWPGFFHVHYTAILMYIIIGIFIAHATIHIKIWLDRKRIPLSNLAYLVAAGSFLMIWLNL